MNVSLIPQQVNNDHQSAKLAHSYCELNQESSSVNFHSFHDGTRPAIRGAAAAEQAPPDSVYVLKPFDSSTTFLYNNFFKEISHLQDRKKNSKKDIAKQLLRERITGKWGSGSDSGLTYLEYNAQTLGDFDNYAKIKDFKYSENIVNLCQKSVIWFKGQDTENHYVKKIDCRKPWCPVCGGKGGKIHNARLHAIMSRVNVEKYNLRQIVLTVPEPLREILKNKENLSLLEKYGNEVIAKHFGEPVFDKLGHVKRYKIKKGIMSYLHLFGEEVGVFKPHLNYHVFEGKKETLKLTKEKMDLIKKDWLTKLKHFSRQINKVDIHYSFRDSAKKVMHSIKYMSRPWSVEDYNAIEDERLKKLLVVDLCGFQYVRFLGSMSNCKFKDEMELSEIKADFESKVHEKLIPLFFAPFDFVSWKSRLEEIDDGFYRVLTKKEWRLKNEL